MSIFDPIEMRWIGKEVTIPANRVLKAIAAVEEILPLDQVVKMANTGHVHIAKCSMAYGAVLRYAGVEVTDEEVYSRFVGVPADAPEMVRTLQALLMMMLPRQMKEGSAAAPKGKDLRRPASASSRKRGKRASAKDVSAPATFGI